VCKKIIKILLFIFILFTDLYARDFESYEVKEAPIKTRKITIEEVVEFGLKNSMDIRIAKYDAYIRRQALPQVKSIFEPFLLGDLNFRRDRFDQGNVLLGTRTDDYDFNLKLDKQFTSGTNLRLDFLNQRIDTDAPVTVFNPFSESILRLSLKQNFGRNKFGLQDRYNVKITKLDIENAEYTSLDDIERYIRELLIAYWTLVRRHEELAVKIQFRAEAKNLVDIYRQKIKIGLVNLGDLKQVESDWRISQNDVLIAELELKDANNELLFLLNPNEVRVRLIPQDTLSTDAEQQNFYDSIRLAVDNRRDYSRLLNLMQINGLDIKMKEDNIWPIIDLDASFARNGVNDTFGEAVEEIFVANQPEYYIGVSLNVPLKIASRKALLKEKTLEKEQLIVAKRRLEREILLDIDKEVREVNIHKEFIEKAIQVVKLEQEKLDEEFKRLRQGRSDADRIIRFRNDVFFEKLTLIFAYYNYRTSLIRLEDDQDTLLDKYWKDSL
jgi:outer membrane protein TolC